MPALQAASKIPNKCMSKPGASSSLPWVLIKQQEKEERDIKDYRSHFHNRLGYMI